MVSQRVGSGAVPGDHPPEKVNKWSDFGWDLSPDRSYASSHLPRAWLLQTAGTKAPVRGLSVRNAG